jgi:hypothetical protein
MHDRNERGESNMKRIDMPLSWWCLLAVAGVGCSAASGPARNVRFTALGRLGRVELEKPLVVAFEPGDRIPLRVGLTGDWIESERGLPIYATVKRRFWIRLDEDVRLSLDGRDWHSFDDVGGKLSVGYGSIDGTEAVTIVFESIAR